MKALIVRWLGLQTNANLVRESVRLSDRIMLLEKEIGALHQEVLEQHGKITNLNMALAFKTGRKPEEARK